MCFAHSQLSPEKINVRSEWGHLFREPFHFLFFSWLLDRSARLGGVRHDPLHSERLGRANRLVVLGGVPHAYFVVVGLCSCVLRPFLHLGDVLTSDLFPPGVNVKAECMVPMLSKIGDTYVWIHMYLYHRGKINKQMKGRVVPVHHVHVHGSWVWAWHPKFEQCCCIFSSLLHRDRKQMIELSVSP